MLKRILYILPLLLIGCKTTHVATSSTPEMTPREQQMRYVFFESQRSLNQGDYARGMALLLFCEQLNPADAATQQSLGYMYQGLQQTETALTHYRRAFEADPTMYWSSYATLLFQTGQRGEAADVLEHVVKLRPKETDALEALQTVYMTDGDTKKALRTADRIEAAEGINAYNTMTRYKLHTAAGQPQKAIQAIDRYLQENPDDQRFRVFRGDLYMATGKKQEAFAIYREEQQRHPENPYVWLSLANYSEYQGDAERAAEYTERAILADGWSLPEKLQEVKQFGERLSKSEGRTERILQQLTADYPLEESAWQTLAQWYIGRGEYDRAKPVLHTLRQLNPDSEAAASTLLHVLQADSTSSNEEYEILISDAYKRFPDNLEWSYWQTRLLLIHQQTDLAIAVASTAARRNGDPRYRLGMWIMLGDIYTLQGNMDSTFAAYEEALKIDPQNIYVLNNYAYMLATHGGDLKRAEKMSQKTIEAEPDNATYLDTYAWILHLQGQQMLAEFYIRKAMNNMSDAESEEIKEHYNAIIQQ